MGGVDIADQLRAGFSTQQRGVKPWRPLFYWLLDSTIINAFQLSENQRKARIIQLGSDKKDKKSLHRAFREALVSELLKNPFPTPPKQVYITKKSILPQIRLTRPIEIHQPVHRKQAPCLFCRWTRQHKRASNWKVITKSCNVPKTRIFCSHCSIPLCGECFFPFHYFVV
jgi:hypothetical protein